VLGLRKALLQQKLLVKETLFAAKKAAYEATKASVEKIRQQAEALKETLDSIKDDLSDDYYQVYQQVAKMADYERILGIIRFFSVIMVINCYCATRLKIKEVLIPPNAKLLLII
jgi:hypothetical protein